MEGDERRPGAGGRRAAAIRRRDSWCLTRTALLALLGAGALSAAAPSAAAADTVLCRLADPRIPESSGVAVASDGRAFYTHNDSGDVGRYFVVGPDCQVLAVHRLAGVTPRDVEDIARGPGGTLLLADIGDNRARRSTVQIYIVDEPATTGAPAGPDPVRTLTLTYPDGPHDAETLLVSDRGEIAVVTKSLTGTAGVYVAGGDSRTATTGQLRRVADVVLAATDTRGGPAGVFGTVAVTGGDLRGDTLVLRTYTDAYLWNVDPNLPLARALSEALAVAPVVRPLPPDPQGEAIAITADGRLLTTSEGVGEPVRELDAPAVPPRQAANDGRGVGTHTAAGASSSARSSPAPADLGVAGWPRLAIAGAVLLVLVPLAGLVAAAVGVRRRGRPPGVGREARRAGERASR